MFGTVTLEVVLLMPNTFCVDHMKCIGKEWLWNTVPDHSVRTDGINECIHGLSHN